MKSIKTLLIALTIAFVSSFTLSGCFVNEDEVFGQVESGASTPDTSKDETNSEEWD